MPSLFEANEPAGGIVLRGTGRSRRGVAVRKGIAIALVAIVLLLLALLKVDALAVVWSNFTGDERSDSALEEARKAAIIRSDMKRSIVAEVIDGRMDLGTAAAAFLDLDKDQPGALEDLRSRFAGRTDREVEAQNVMACVRSHEPAVPDNVLNRLASEMAEAFPK